MKSLYAILVSSTLLIAVPGRAEELREIARPVRPAPVKNPPLARLIPRPATPKLAPIPMAYEISDSMTSEEVYAIATKEYALLAKLVGEYGRRPEFAALEKAADAHFAEGTRRLAEEVKAILQAGSIGETPEEAFRREVEALGREVSAILSQGSIGTNAPRYSPTTPAGSAKPSTGTSTGKAIGAGMARD